MKINLIQHMILCLSVAIAFSYVFWGLKIFKFYIILIGAVLGGVLGTLWIGMEGGDLFAIIGGALLFGIVGGIIAWPLQKLFASIICGSVTAVFGTIFFALMDLPNDAWPIYIICVFLSGVIITWILYDYFVIITMSLTASLSLFNVLATSRLIFSTNKINDLWDQLLKICSYRISGFICIIVVFVSFAMVFQIVSAKKDSDDVRTRSLKSLFRKTSYFFASLYFIGFFLSGLLYIAFNYYFDFTIIFGMNLISWPIAAFLTTYFIFWLNDKWDNSPRTFNITVAKFICIMIFGITLIPFVYFLTSSLLYLNFEPLNLNYYMPARTNHSITTILSKSSTYYYSSFFNKGYYTMIINKWVYSLIIFPFLIYIYLLRPLSLERRRN